MKSNVVHGAPTMKNPPEVKRNNDNVRNVMDVESENLYLRVLTTIYFSLNSAIIICLIYSVLIEQINRTKSFAVHIDTSDNNMGNCSYILRNTFSLN